MNNPTLSDILIDLCLRAGLEPDVPAIKALDEEAPMLGVKYTLEEAQPFMARGYTFVEFYDSDMDRNYFLFANRP
jgi:hypothetical protein